MTKYRVNARSVRPFILLNHGVNMNITFTNEDYVPSEKYSNIRGTTTQYSASPARSAGDSRISLDISSKVTDNEAYKGHGKTAKDVMMKASSMDVEAQRDYLTVMSNCVSSEDLAKMQKEGFNPGSTEIDDVVTIVDHIKAAVAKGGTVVYGYTDDISKEALEEITGSVAYANELKDDFAKKDIPLTEENARQVKEAYDYLSKLPEVSEAAVKYLVENNLVPSVENLYTAVYSSGNDAGRQGRGYYSDGMNGYYAKKPETVDVEALRPQLEELIKKAGFEVSDKTVEDATWLVEKGIPLTKESLTQYENIKSVALPMTFSTFASHATDAIMDHIKVKSADLSRKTSFIEEAVSIYEEVQNEGTIRGRRVLEEVRLHMTVDANLKLLKSGFSIDTAPMEDLIKNLKEIEKEYAINLTGDDNETQAVRKKDIFADTIEASAVIKNAPISISFVYEANESLSVVKNRAETLKADYESASKEYEKLMTAPRKDLGDSIKKAFGNIDEILEDMKLPTTEENRRAVRILGYNNIEITDEKISLIKEKDRLLTQTIEAMTPGRVLGMIRNNVNPLEMTVSELDKYLRDQDTTKEDMESYSRFLYRLEKNGEISEDEKEAYIGIYRLVHSIEKADFSAVGAVSEIGSQFSFSNILSALRSRKHAPMDYKVDDSFGGMSAVDRGIASITTQIAKGFVTDTKDLKDFLQDFEDEEADREYNRLMAMEYSSSLRAEADVLRVLEEQGTPLFADNIASAKAFTDSPESVFKKLKEIGYKKPFKTLADSKEKMQEAFEEITEDAKDFIRNEVFDIKSGDIKLKAMDVRMLSSLYSRMEYLGERAREEDYVIPVEIDGSTVAINLRVLHNTDGKENSKAEISFNTETYGKITGIITASEKGLKGAYSSSTTKGLKMLAERKSEIDSFLEKETDTDVISTDDLYKASKIFIETVLR